jgi:hypothetical protein
MRYRDQEQLLRGGERALRGTDPYQPALTEGGTKPGSKVGAKIVSLLDGPVSSYFVDIDPDSGRACLYQTVDSDDLLDPGSLNEGGGMTGDSMARVRNNDRAWMRNRLAAINAANRRYYGTK